MAASNDNTMAQCAACGKGGDGLKKCGACELVRYCGATCQRAHSPTHKEACRRRAAELHDEALFRQPPSQEECPICFLELPLYSNMQTYKSCCGKIICDGCEYATIALTGDDPCPFCRKPGPCSEEEDLKRRERRIELNDPCAMFMLGLDYFDGGNGFQQDIEKALELHHVAAELGSIDAHFNLGIVHHRDNGNGVQVNNEKAKYHYEKAAIAGHIGARHNLGTMEANGGNLHRAMKHFIISANAGHDDSLKKVQYGYRDGLVNKDDFEKALRAHQKSQNETRSEWRVKAVHLHSALCTAPLDLNKGK